MRRTIIAVLLCQVAALLILTSPTRAQGTLPYDFPGLRGRAVADEDGQPLAGATVLALWISHAPAPYQFKLVHVVESQTHTNGTFVLPGWTTRLSNPLQSESPSILVFATGRVAHTST